MKKRVLSLLMVMVMMLAMTGCGAKEASAIDLLTKAQENSQAATNMTAKSNMEISMTSAGETIAFNTVMDMTVFTDPYKAKVDMTMDMGELGSQESNVYMAMDGDKYYTYTGMAGEWYKQEMDKTLFEQSISGYDSTAYMDAMLSNAESFTVEETEENGKKLYKLDGVITGESMMDMLNATNMMSQLAATGIDTSMYENLGDMNVTLYLDKEAESLYKMSMDMTSMMQTMMEQAMADLGSEEAITIDKCVMDMEYTGFNNAEDFEVPEEALNAEELSM